MNRYTFKAKRKDNGEWVYGDLMHTRKVCFGKDDENILIIFSITNRSDYYEIIPETLCQCTGLQDRDGNDIFENDILTVVGKKYTVEFKNGMFGVMINNNTKFIDLYWWIKENKKANNNYKIIGNKCKYRIKYNIGGIKNE